MKNLYITVFNAGQGLVCNLAAGEVPPTFRYDQPIYLLPTFTVPEANVTRLLGHATPQTLVVQESPTKDKAGELAQMVVNCQYLAERFGDEADKENINNLITKVKAYGDQVK